MRRLDGPIGVEFGALEIHPLNQHPDHPEILVISNIEEDGGHIGIHDAGRYWHSDLSYMAEPSRAAILHAIEIPHSGGRALGGTLWAGDVVMWDNAPTQHIAICGYALPRRRLLHRTTLRGAA